MKIIKDIQRGSIEALGYIGMFIWVIAIILRKIELSNNAYYDFFLGILPNLGAAWAITMFGKWFLVLVIKRSFNLKAHIFLCVSVLFFAFCSEVIHDLFLNSPFDVYDIIVTITAQAAVLFVPILIKDKSFRNNSK